MRNGEPFVLIDEVIVQQYIQVDDPVRIGLPWLVLMRSAHLSLNLLCSIEQGQWAELRLVGSHCIGEAMVAAKAPWLALDIVRTGQLPAHRLAHQSPGRVDVMRPIAQI